MNMTITEYYKTIFHEWDHGTIDKLESTQFVSIELIFDKANEFEEYQRKSISEAYGEPRDAHLRDMLFDSVKQIKERGVFLGYTDKYGIVSTEIKVFQDDGSFYDHIVINSDDLKFFNIRPIALYGYKSKDGDIINMMYKPRK